LALGLVLAVAVGGPGVAFVRARLAARRQQPALGPRPCPSGLGPGWRCAVVTVPLDRSGRVPGRVRLAVALRHVPGPPRPAVLALAGGPGSAAIPEAPGFARTLAPLLRRRDLLLIDQRGTGVSDPIACPTVNRLASWSADLVARCARALGPARAFYGSLDTARDVADVRRLLRIPRLAVAGVSYGTKTALDVARVDPRHVDGLVLDSPIVEDTDPFYRRSAVGAARVLRAVCQEEACPRGDDPAADLQGLVGRMRDGTLRAGTATITEAQLLHAVVAGGRLLRALPAALHAAAAGRLGPLAALLPAQVPDAREPDWLAPSGSRTLYLATSCDDGAFPWRRRDPLDRRRLVARRYLDRLGDAAFAPFDRHVGEQYGEAPICAPWPEAGHVTPPGPLPDVPALLLVGGDDDLAPLEGAEEVAASLPHARVVVAAGVGHGVLGGSAAAQAALAAFAAG
jgi:pimeloyl-ACP methyl ester carboxylesterase